MKFRRLLAGAAVAALNSNLGITERKRRDDADTTKTDPVSDERVSRPHGASMQGERHLISGVTAGETEPQTRKE